MNKRNIGKIAGLMAAGAIWMGASTSANAAYTFQNITHNGNLDISSQLSMAVSGSGSSLTLTFYNNVGIASSICDIYIDAPPPGVGESPYPYFVAGSPAIASSAGVAFNTPAHPGNLPGGESITPDFVASAQSVDSNSPVSANGVNALNEWVALSFTLTGPTTVADVVEALNSGQFRVGLHVQAIENGSGSDSYVTAVPEPTTLAAGALLLLPFGASVLRKLRKNRTA